MLDFGYYNIDCMEGMKQFPDKYFELAIVDPPYGIGAYSDGTMGGVFWQSKVHTKKLNGILPHPKQSIFWNLKELAKIK